jgi:hypothetical protein
MGRFVRWTRCLGSNRFAYVGNDPINLVYPTGMDAACSTNPFSNFALPLCGPDQFGSAVGSNCGGNFCNDGFSINFTSNCSSFSINLGSFGGVPFGDLGQTIHNTLATFFNIDTCPEGGFECPEGGRSLFGTPSCGPFCVMDATLSPGTLDGLNDYCSARGRAKFIADWVPGGGALVRSIWGSPKGEALGAYQLSTADIDRITEENHGAQTVATHAASEALKAASKSTSFLYALRAKTGVPMTAAAKILGRLADVALITDAFIGFNAEAHEILDCQAGR